jgi:signal transduction histidine kinase
MSAGDANGEEERYLRTAFLERVAHELRGPAGVIHGALQELELALGPDAAAHRHLLEIALRGVRRVVRTADRLQQTSVCARGSVRITLTSCDFAELVRKSVAEAEALEARKKIVVHLELPPGPMPCNVDARWVGVALHEVASNAIRHARERVEVDVGELDGDLQVSFRDDSTSNTAFGPVRFVAPREGRGLGLALAIVRDVIEAHGGQLEIDLGRPAPAKPGASVRIQLPRSQAPPAIGVSS